ncbi:MAG: hypothetical protein AAF581_10110 [Planctomycetota bacterium]
MTAQRTEQPAAGSRATTAFPVLAGTAIVYLLIGAATGLAWPLFRDEPMYLKGTLQTQESFPGLTFWLNINAVGVLLWAALLEWVHDSVAVLRLSVLLFGLGTFWLFASLCARFREARVGRALLLVVLVPEVFLYCYQVNGTLLTLFGAFAASLVFMSRQQSGPSWHNDALLFVTLAWVCLQSPFCLSFLPAVILTEFFARRREGRAFAQQIPVRTGGIAVLAFAAWGVFILTNGTPLSESLQRHSVGENPGILGLHFGNWAIFAVMWGGLLPFLGVATAGIVRWQRVVPFLLGAALLAYFTLPANGYAFAWEFHTIYTMALDRGAAALGLPLVFVNVAYLVLAVAGTYVIVNFLVFTWRQPQSLFPLVLLACYMSLMLVDGFIASRLFLPGWIVLTIYMERAFVGKERLYAVQVGYQALICIVYTLALGSKHGFLGL